MTSEHSDDDVLALLPWYATGTLSEAEMRRVDAALARDPSLARHLDLIGEERESTIRLNEALGTPSAQAAARLFAAIDQEPVRPRARLANVMSAIAAFLSGLSPRTLALSAGVAVLALVLQAGVIVELVRGGGLETGYRTASAPGAPVGAGSFVLIRFAPQANLGEVTKFLTDNKLAIVAGPAPGGVYRARLSAEAMSTSDIAARIDQLQGNAVVTFVAASE